ncbi:MarC family protein [Rhodoligotrophos ferricapiens]|uniref:MarC family protein n=1 Tax=Rhodoligotrophos ferricapiens TaxID=3069264 RepID=UPI00315C9F0E
MDAHTLLSAIATLVVTIDPIGLVPVFLSLTPNMSASDRRRVAVRATLITFGILAFFAIAGHRLLEWLQIGLPAFRIAGGLLLFWIAFEMIFERRTERKQHTASEAVTKDQIHDLATFPLAIPLMAGPGAITAVILLAAREDRAALGLPLLLLLLALIAGLCLAVFFAAERLSRFLGTTGNLVLTRLLGLILTAMAVQFVIDGVSALDLIHQR